MLAKTTRMSAVAAVLAATAIVAPSATAKPIETTLPAGINTGLGPSSGLATTTAPSAAGKLSPSFGLAGDRFGERRQAAGCGSDRLRRAV